MLITENNQYSGIVNTYEKCIARVRPVDGKQMLLHVQGWIAAIAVMGAILCSGQTQQQCLIVPPALPTAEEIFCKQQRCLKCGWQSVICRGYRSEVKALGKYKINTEIQYFSFHCTKTNCLENFKICRIK